MSAGKHFTCAQCGETYETEWTDEMAAAEFERNFQSHPKKETSELCIVCDDCYEDFWISAKKKYPMLKRMNREDLS